MYNNDNIYNNNNNNNNDNNTNNNKAPAQWVPSLMGT